MFLVFEEVACVQTPLPSGKIGEGAPSSMCVCEAQSLNEQIDATVLFLRVYLYFFLLQNAKFISLGRYI